MQAFPIRKVFTTTRMKNRTIVGIVAEYNPFHTGHRYQIRAAAEQVSADAVVAVMSGHFMQRGSFAVTDKWTRAAMALSSGVDAVIEIPVRYCLGNASIYAAAGIGLLEASGIVTHLSFGTESGDLSQLQNTAARITGSRERLEERIRELGREGHSYPRARMIADAELSGEPEIPSEPNDILALEYLRANHSMTVIPVHRQGAGYHEEIGGDTEFPSSTGLRQLLREGKDIRAFLPEPPDGSDWKFYTDEEPWFRLIRYRILNCGIEEICCAPGGEEGLAYLLRDAVRTAVSIDDLILRVKSKRYTYTRISRLLYQLLLGITRETQQEAPEYLRVLGFTDKGRELLRLMKQEAALPVITNVNKADVRSGQLLEEFRATDLYNLCTGRSIRDDSDQVRKPVMM